ncbi:GNAT family acetyltransferase [Legionella sainthelensi]|uniref:GNAT family N-acetyltransferase n=1 Tax=Legionella sainthelensi TaxID=28087 RepID=UPI000F71C604|nr:GNAT family N-acetyltransferase [Legionella sainthelensi]VEB35396.1 GNAT family acetyltransferase [Legionella sainthelensi]
MTDNNLTIVAEEDGKILGCFTAMNFDNNPSIKKEEMELRYLYVHVDHWRKGIGTKLALEMATRLLAAGYNSVSGCALESDVAANAFYTSLKAEVKCTKTIYIPIGTTPESYPGGAYTKSNEYVIHDLRKTLSLLSLSTSQTHIDTNDIFTYLNKIGFFALNADKDVSKNVNEPEILQPISSFTASADL